MQLISVRIFTLKCWLEFIGSSLPLSFYIYGHMKLQSLTSNMREKEEKVQDVSVLKRKDSYEDVNIFVFPHPFACFTLLSVWYKKRF